jgi:cytochrome c-type biogenesis protein CcmE
MTSATLKKKQRIKFITISALISLSALIFIITNFRDNIVFFYSPSELLEVNISHNKIIRVGGLVKEGSVKQEGKNLEFTITDLQSDLIIEYSGIKPNLFRAGQGMIAKGILNKKQNRFKASELLAKHDENYMPPEVKKSLKNQDSKIKQVK